jgi:hypothetical protein
MSIGAGAIFQVVYSIGSWMLRSHNQYDEVKEIRAISVNIFIIVGFAAGMTIMYVTGLLV